MKPIQDINYITIYKDNHPLETMYVSYAGEWKPVIIHKNVSMWRRLKLAFSILFGKAKFLEWPK